MDAKVIVGEECFFGVFVWKLEDLSHVSLVHEIWSVPVVTSHHPTSKGTWSKRWVDWWPWIAEHILGFTSMILYDLLSLEKGIRDGYNMYIYIYIAIYCIYWDWNRILTNHPSWSAWKWHFLNEKSTHWSLKKGTMCRFCHWSVIAQKLRNYWKANVDSILEAYSMAFVAPWSIDSALTVSLVHVGSHTCCIWRIRKSLSKSLLNLFFFFKDRGCFK